MKPRYRKISVAIWNDETVRALSAEGILVLIFLLTHPGTTSLGTLRATPEGLASELRQLTGEAFAKGFSEVYSLGFIRIDQSGPLIWFPNFMKHNAPESPNVVRSWIHAFHEMPECSLRTQVLQGIERYVSGLTKGFQEAFSEAFGEVIGKTSPNQEQEQEQEKTSPTPPLQSAAPRGKRPSTTAPRIRLTDYIGRCTADGVQHLPASDPIFRYAEKIGLPDEFLALGWSEFCRDHIERGTRQVDWKAHFRNAVRRNWLKLWYPDKMSGEWRLTTAGEQAARAQHGGRAA